IGIIVPAVGGVLAAFLGAANAIALDAASFLISAALLVCIPRTFNAARSAQFTGGLVVAHMLGDIRDGLAFLWPHRLIRTLTLVGFGNSFSSGAVVGLLVVYAVRALGLSETDGRVGLLYTSTAVGGLVASLLLPRLTRRMAVGRITMIG